MNIKEFSLNLQKIYDEMAETFAAYQKTTGLACPTGCGRCCLNPDVEASMFEMIPLALKIYEEGKLDEWLLALEHPTETYCSLFKLTGEGRGFCTSYQERPSVCRMFAVAGTYDKHHEVTPSICKHLKEGLTQAIAINDSTPLIPNWTAKLSTLNPELTKNRLPMNQAIKEALEYIAFYAQYQNISP